MALKSGSCKARADAKYLPSRNDNIKYKKIGTFVNVLHHYETFILNQFLQPNTTLNPFQGSYILFIFITSRNNVST